MAVKDLIASTIVTRHKDLGFRLEICSRAVAEWELLHRRKSCRAYCSGLHHSLLGQWCAHYLRKFSFAAFAIVVELLTR